MKEQEARKEVLNEIAHMLASNSYYRGNDILQALYAVVEGKEVKEIKTNKHLVDDRVILKSLYSKLSNNLQQRDFVKGYTLIGVLDEFNDIAKEYGVVIPHEEI